MIMLNSIDKIGISDPGVVMNFQALNIKKKIDIEANHFLTEIPVFSLLHLFSPINYYI